MTTLKSSAFQLPAFGGLFFSFENQSALLSKISATGKKLASAIRDFESANISFKLPSFNFLQKTENGIILKQSEIFKALGAVTTILMVTLILVAKSLRFSSQGMLSPAVVFSPAFVMFIFCLAACIIVSKIKKEFNAYQSGLIQQNDALIEKNASLETLLATGKQQQEKLERTVLLKERLISIISHDVRVPLNAFKFLIECYEKGFVSQEAALAGIIETKKDLVKTDNMIVDLVNFARTGKSAADAASLSFQQSHEVMESVLSIYTLCAKNKQLEIVPIIDMPENSSLKIAKRDVEVIIRNLLSNAIKYSNTGGKIIVSLKAEGNYATLKVQDFGKGMNDQMLKKLCTNKVISSMGTQDEIGLGIGLNIIYDVINDYNLTYDVKSKIGCGTEFSVQIPMATL